MTPSALGPLFDVAARAASLMEGGRLPSADHRPWPLPRDPWIMAQTWEELLFAHWPVPADAVARLIPRKLPLDTFDGSAWVAVTPLIVTGLRGRGLPPVPGLSTFPEINVRTYVTLGGKPGVFFFSLDAASALAVQAARLSYRLPYYRARFSVEKRGEWILYANSRSDPGAPPADFSAEYGPIGDPAPARPGTFAWWGTERYCLYSVDRRGAIYRAEIHHAPWPLRPAEARIQRNTMTSAAGIKLPDLQPVVHFARRLDVKVWAPVRVADAEGRGVA